MEVNVELKAPASIDGLKCIVEQWQTQFPMGKLIGLSNYMDVTLTLRMPPATQVIPPQITDTRGTTEEETT